MIATESFIMQDAFLSGLNTAQSQAVKHDPKVSLQILAGPGSGKTKVLTSRIAYLILEHSMSPSSICAVTFTNKAANEMRKRLRLLIGEKCTNDIKLGTFHALCAVFLRKYGNLIGLDSNFTICDADESKKIISSILKPHKNILEKKCISLKEETILSMISKAKARNFSPAEFLSSRSSKTSTSHGSQEINSLISGIYEEYERRLRSNNSLDFDDLLVFGVKLFTQHQRTVCWCNHLLVDEFQDTNHIQYGLVTALVPSQCLTVVGDPDQSIYGWRSAEIQNFANMRRDFCGTREIFLEENYRSTASILKTSLAIIAQDKSRVQKSLRTSHPAGPNPVLHLLANEHAEASSIAHEIKGVVAQMGGALLWGDFAVLLRFNALSRTIESALQREGIPCRVLGGQKFFERMEIKNLLAYLQLTDNPSFDPAFTRAVNVPTRGIGEKSFLGIAERAAIEGKSYLDFIESVCDGTSADIKPAIRRKLSSFVKTIKNLRELANKGTSPSDLIRYLLDLVDYEGFLKKTQPDWESRWENVQELITFANEVSTDITSSEKLSPSHTLEGDNSTNVDSPLRSFLQASMLSTEIDQKDDNNYKEKVTIATCHAAKGLEWPVVMIPAVESGIFPFYRSEDTEEERRLLYVACTRAQCLLYLSSVEKRTVAGDEKSRVLSEFVSMTTNEDTSMFENVPQILSAMDKEVISNILNRPLPDEVGNTRLMTEVTEAMQNCPLRSPNPSTSTPLFVNEIQRAQISKKEVYIPAGRSGLSLATLQGPLYLNTSELLPGKTKEWQPFNHSVRHGDSSCQSAAALAEHREQTETRPQPYVQENHTTKRRLGMGRSVNSYANKKYKMPSDSAVGNIR